MSTLKCSQIGRCGGCPTGHVEYKAQIAAKLAGIPASIEKQFTTIAQSRLRDRVEFMWDSGHFGLTEVGRRTVVDLNECPMLSAPLEEWFKEYRLKSPPIQRGSVRLRVSPSGQRGVWLDFANVDVKNLFEEREYLEWLSTQAIVEIGQRRKRFVFKDGKPKLIDPELFPWFETYGQNDRAIPLYGVIGGFTQVGFRANRVLVDKVVQAVENSKQREWVELFAGNGNFSLALADRGYTVEAFENDDIAVNALQRSIDEGNIQTLKVTRADVYHQPQKLATLEGKGLLVDPPRSGLGKFLAMLENVKPQTLVYVSCFSESFARDSEHLTQLGYKMESLEAVDQFPNSEHIEWVSAFTLQNP